MYIVYILVVGFGRCTRLTKKKKKGNFVQKNDLYYNAYMIKTVRDGIRRQSRGLDSIQEDLARLGYQVSEDGVVDVAKKIVCGYVTVDGEI